MTHQPSSAESARLLADNLAKEVKVRRDHPEFYDEEITGWIDQAERIVRGTVGVAVEPTPAMVDAALNAWFKSPPSETDQGLERSMKAALTAAALTTAPAQAVPAEPVDITGWKLVPNVPTEEMWQAGLAADTDLGDSYTQVWGAMFDAAPNVDDCETTRNPPQAETAASFIERTMGSTEPQAVPASEDVRTAHKAIKSALNEVYGVWDAFEFGIRQEISNTNYAVVREKLDAAERALASLSLPRPEGK